MDTSTGATTMDTNTGATTVDTNIGGQNKSSIMRKWRRGCGEVMPILKQRHKFITQIESGCDI